MRQALQRAWSHRGALAWLLKPLSAVYAALGISGPVLSPGQGLVIHHRKGKVVASELI